MSVDDDDDENEEDDSNEAERVEDAANKDDQTVGSSGSVSAGEEGSDKDEEEEPVTSGLSRLSDGSKSQISPLSDVPSSRDSPSQSEPAQDDNQRLMSNGDDAGSEEPVDSSNHNPDKLENTSEVTKDPADVTPVVANEVSLHPSPACDTHMTNGTSPPPSPRTTRSRKRKREEVTRGTSRNTKHTIIYDSR